MQQNQEGGNFYRADIAKWYNIGESGLRKRMTKKKVHIENRALTDDDIRLILKGLGRPQGIPNDLWKHYFPDKDS
jgi:hypothetical protein